MGSDQIPETIRDVVRKIVTSYRPQKVILFGSYAYGDPDEDSDIDLLIIKDTDKRPLDRWIEVKRLVRDRSRRAPVSPIVLTSKELEERLEIRDFFLQDILEKGQVLYE